MTAAPRHRRCRGEARGAPRPRGRAAFPRRPATVARDRRTGGQANRLTQPTRIPTSHAPPPPFALARHFARALRQPRLRATAPAEHRGTDLLHRGRRAVDARTVKTAREIASHSTGTPEWTNPPEFAHDVFTFVRIIRDRDPYGSPTRRVSGSPIFPTAT